MSAAFDDEIDVHDKDEGRSDEGPVVVLAGQVVALERPVQVRVLLDLRECVAVQQKQKKVCSCVQHRH